MNEYIIKLQNILSSFLGEPKGDITNSYQLQYPCPRCIENKGESERHKHNLEINLQRGVFQCWSCVSADEPMHGSIYKLIKMYGNDTILKDYKETLIAFKESDLYKLHFNNNDFSFEKTTIENKELVLPPNYHKFLKNGYNPKKSLEYLFNRNIKWDIIEEYNIGYTSYDENNKQLSSRIIIPSYNALGELNYWTGRDFLSLKYRQKYFNPKVERKNIIFNEEKISWDADITLVEGPFDHIVVPNSIPLLGKKISRDFKLYNTLQKKCNANVNIWLDNDAVNNAKELYALLDNSRLSGKIRMIVSEYDKDPSEIYEKYGAKGIIQCMKHTMQIPKYKLV